MSISFVWANLAHGRERIRLMVALQCGFALLVGLVSLAPYEAGGLALVVLVRRGARVLWAGILTVRAAVWTANYPRNVLARITGRIVIVSSLAVAASAALVGWALESQAIDPRWLYSGGAVAGLVAPGFTARCACAASFGCSPRSRRPGRATSPSACACCARSWRRIRLFAATCSGWACSAAATSC